MPAKYKKYPIYTYDEPATYKDFVGGINTNPSNEHLQPNELRDCVNMHYSSAGLIKRNGAKKLCNIVCEDELYNVQGIFLFTYKITYLILACDGKLYKGFYNEHSNIVLKRIYINSEVVNNYEMYSPDNVITGLNIYTEELTNVLHDGFIHRRFFSSEGNLNITNPIIYNLEEQPDGFTATNNSIIKYNNQYYLSERGGINDYIKILIFPTNSEYWVEATTENILQYKDLIEYNYNKHVYAVGVINTGTEEEPAYALDGIPKPWVEQITDYGKGEVVSYDGKEYICIKKHNCLSTLPEDSGALKRIYYKDSLIFQNKSNIGFATYNNKCYIATGTRFIEMFVENNELIAQVVRPYRTSYNEIKNLGYNLLSPYPELCRETLYNQATTSVDIVLPIQNTYGTYILTPIMTYANDETENDYAFKWEKFYKNKWVTVISFQDNYIRLNTGEISKIDFSKLEVFDANVYKYRVTVCNTFKLQENLTEQNYYILNGKRLLTETIEKLSKSNTIIEANDFVPDNISGWFASANSVIATPSEVNRTYQIIQSCTKITSDGNKLLLYGDRFNSGSWFKTKVDNPYYISERGSLSFKTSRNEELIKVVPFSGNLIAFANSANVGGSIHLVTGNGDDYDQDDYYSPYKRSIISEGISCDNENTIQVCENLLFFKYYNTIYYIVSSELSNEVINLYSANDRIKLSSPFVSIPWDDNTCISEVTEDYYALIWKEKYTLENGELFLEHPGIKVKLYYKIYNEINQKIYFPWLRDESNYFNIKGIFYSKGKPIYLYNNTLITFSDENVFTDLDEPYECLIHFRGVDTNYPKMVKILNNICLYYFNTANSQIDLELICTNEAGHKLIDSSSNRKSLQELRTLKTGTPIKDNEVRTGFVTLAQKTFVPQYSFPYLIAETVLKVKNKDMFAVSSLTYVYTSVDTPDDTVFDLYANIIKKKEM